MRKICIITGTRAEYGLFYWLMKEIDNNNNLELQVIATGMHLSAEFGNTYQQIEKDGFTINKKVDMLLSSDTEVAISKSMGLGIIGFSDAFDDLKPDLLVVLGDRFEIFSAVSAAMIARIPVAHLHGGETTEGSFDESIRHSITKMSHLHFTATNKYKNRVTLSLIIFYPLVSYVLIAGGFGILMPVSTDQWGGLLLTLIIASVGIIVSFPIGVLLALGRQSDLKVIKLFSTLFIEFIRAVPLITILFMASFVLPLFLESGNYFDKLLRALIGIALFQAAYFAEVVRGGLQAIPRGQYEAADAIGLSYFQKNALIILPQALKISIPNIVGSSISLFKDTTLVLIIGLFDMLAMVNLTSNDPYWLARETEGFVFVTIVMWAILYTMSRYSKKLEIRFNTENKN